MYQLQNLVATGQVGGEDEAGDNGTWTKINEIERLRRFLPSAKAAATPGAQKIRIGNVELEVGPDGKPLPPSPEVMARLLGGELREADRSDAKWWRLMWWGGLAFVVVEAGYAMWMAFGR